MKSVNSTNLSWLAISIFVKLVCIVEPSSKSLASKSAAPCTVLFDIIAPALRASLPNSSNPAALFLKSGTSAVASDAIASIKNVKSCWFAPAFSSVLA